MLLAGQPMTIFCFLVTRTTLLSMQDGSGQKVDTGHTIPQHSMSSVSRRLNSEIRTISLFDVCSLLYVNSA